ncbi:hypothetical protein FKM82_008827 [Ascaphus truei]
MSNPKCSRPSSNPFSPPTPPQLLPSAAVTVMRSCCRFVYCVDTEARLPRNSRQTKGYTCGWRGGFIFIRYFSVDGFLGEEAHCVV